MVISVEDDVTVILLLGVSFVSETLIQKRKTKRGIGRGPLLFFPPYIKYRGLEGVLIEQQ
jgi:hypothetical protein